MPTEEFMSIPGLKCEVCGTKEDVTYDEDGREICFDCLFEERCEEG